MFNWIVGIPLLTLFGSTALAISILPSSRQESGRITLKVLLVLIALWTFSSLMYHSTTNPSTLFWLYFILLFALATGAVGIHFCVQHTRSRGRLAKSAVPVFYLLTSLLAIATLTGTIVTSAVLLPNGAVESEFGPLAPAMWGTITLATLIAIAILISDFIKYPSNRTRFTVLPIVGFIILTFGGMSNLFISQYPIDILANFVFISLLTYSVVSSRILKPSVYENRWFSGAGIFLMLVICYVGVFIFSLEWLELNPGISHISAAVISSVLFFSTFGPVRLLLTSKLVEYIFPFSHRYYESLNSINKVDRSLRKWESSVTTILNTIVKTTRAKEASFFIRNDEAQCFKAEYKSNNHSSGLSPVRLPVDSPVIKALKEKGGSLTVEEIEKQIHDNDISGSFDNGLLCGLEGYDGLIAIIVVTREFPGGWKQNEDRDFLELACRQATPMIENSLLYQSIQRELTERKRAQNALEESEAKYRALVENADDYIFMIGKDLKVLSMNESAGKLLGSTPKTLIGKSITDIFPIELSTKYSQSIHQVFETGIPLMSDSSLNIGEQKIVLDTVISPIKDVEGQVIAIIGVSRDITERKQMEEQLHHSQVLASLGQMTAGIAHEVGNPLASILLYSEMAAGGDDVSRQTKKDLKVIQKEAKRAGTLMKDLLIYSRKIGPTMRRMDLNGVIEKVIGLRQYQEKVHNINLTTDLLKARLNVSGDVSQLTQVFLNLILNAEEAVKDKGNGNITISSSVEGGWVKASVSDDGPGIPKENLDKIFLPFFTTKAIGEGTGLGLSTCFGIVSEHDGLINAINNEDGGATFTVQLPVYSRHK